MAYNGSGVFLRLSNWQADAAAGVKIRADYHDAEDNGFATGLTNAITRDGQSPPSENLPMNGKVLTNLGNGVNPTDSVNLGQLQAVRTFATGINMSGAGANTRLEYPQADMSFFVRSIGDPTAGDTAPRFVWNNKADGTGTDVAKLDDTGALTIVNQLTANSVSGGTFLSPNTNVVLGTTGAGLVHLRPQGYGSAANEVYITDGGSIHVTGTGATVGGEYNATVSLFGNLRCKNLAAGGYGGNVATLFWNGGAMVLGVDNTGLGTINTTSDYRIKKDVADLPSTWEQVKDLRPISYTQAAFTPPMSDEMLAAQGPEAKPAQAPLFEANDIEQWGFIAHETQETLLETAASGTKDMEDGVQGLNLAPILAATVRALQEAMARIEALEAAQP